MRIMGWFCLLWMILIAQVSCQKLDIDSCTTIEVTFTCTIRGSSSLTSLILAWRSSEYIGQGNALQFTTDAMPGMNRTSMINGNVTATLTNNTMIDGVPELISALHIVSASQNSVITCSSTTNGSLATTEFTSAFPGRPQNVDATELSADSCVILVSWEPPANIDRSDIRHYIIYVPSQNMMNVSFSTTKVLTIPNCGSDDCIQVAAVNHLGCIGQNSSLIKLNLLGMRTTQPFASLVIGLLSALVVVVVVAVVILSCLIYVLYQKVKNHKCPRPVARNTDQKEKDKPTCKQEVVTVPSESQRKDVEVPAERFHKDDSSGGDTPMKALHGHGRDIEYPS